MLLLRRSRAFTCICVRNFWMRKNEGVLINWRNYRVLMQMKANKQHLFGFYVSYQKACWTWRMALITDTDISFLVLKLSRVIVLFSSTNIFGKTPVFEYASVAFLKSVSILCKTRISAITFTFLKKKIRYRTGPVAVNYFSFIPRLLCSRRPGQPRFLET